MDDAHPKDLWADLIVRRYQATGDLNPGHWSITLKLNQASQAKSLALYEAHRIAIMKETAA